ncbi:hypothetical protein MF672_008205 [Actinomadura sp. ATCC 31491]|uniref:DUF4386 family protein n=1 Tax=Actinomadura luzonensis TaxID=2805427 RepID=A0ABT0FN56_9ACTN|nr:hypothetical protein [Actinomadura luzonensis]MCK2213769.1 hypothetical protein [Actinomadura luzonensis]
MNTDTFYRRAAGASLLLAPVLLLLALIVDPTPQSGQAEGVAYAADPAGAGLTATLLHYCWLLLVPGVLGMLAGVRAGGPGSALARAAAVLAVPGLVSMAALPMVDFFESAAYRRLPAERAGELLDAAYQPAVIFGWQLPGLAGTLLGLVLAGVAVARARQAGWWLPAGTAAGLALFLAGARSGTLLLSLSGPVLLTITFGAVGLTLLRPPTATPAPAL